MKKIVPMHATATRFPFVIVSILPVFGAAAWLRSISHAIDPLWTFLAAIGVGAAHLGANTLNDFFDWDGSDRINPAAGPFNGGSRHLLEGRVPRSRFLLLSVICFIVAAIVLAVFVTDDKAIVVPFAIGGALLGILYSLPPFSLQSRGFGEAAIFIAFGPLITAGTCAALTGVCDPASALPGIPFGIMTMCIVLVNEIPDMAADSASGKRTFAVRFGTRATALAIVVVQSLSLVFTFMLGAIGVFAKTTAIVSVIAIGPLVVLTRGIWKRCEEPKQLLPYQAGIIVYHVLWSLAFAIVHVVRFG